MIKTIPIKYRIPNNLFAFDKLHSRDEQFLLPEIPHVVINCLAAQKQLRIFYFSQGVKMR